MNGIRQRYFSSFTDSLITLAGLALLLYVLWHIIHWAFISALFTTAGDPLQCKDVSGACWAVIAEKWRLILFGLYPYAEQWRSGLACAIVVAMIVISCFPAMWTLKRIVLIWGLGGVSFYILMKGGVFGLSVISEGRWGGLTLTLFIFIFTCVIGMPLAVILSLLRRSRLPVIAKTVALMIYIARSLPMLAILFAFAFMLPLVTPSWFTAGKLYRAMIGGVVYFAAYQAEIIRGGMQSVPMGQREAAESLGLGNWQYTFKILLPQTFRVAMPAMINQFGITFKETSLFVVIGFFELLASGNAAYSSGRWQPFYIEVYAFTGFIYFIFVFSLSRYGAFLERRLNKGQQ